MSWYRNTYLKSEHWSNLRLFKLGSVDAKCNLCGVRDLSNDVHHIVYKKLYDIELGDLVVVCRGCHKEVHEAIERCQKMVNLEGALKRWNKTVNSIKRDRARNARDAKAQAIKRSMKLFSELRQKLVVNRVIPFHSAIIKPKGKENHAIIHGMIRNDDQHFIRLCRRLRLFTINCTHQHQPTTTTN